MKHLVFLSAILLATVVTAGPGVTPVVPHAVQPAVPTTPPPANIAPISTPNMPPPGTLSQPLAQPNPATGVNPGLTQNNGVNQFGQPLIPGSPQVVQPNQINPNVQPALNQSVQQQFQQPLANQFQQPAVNQLQPPGQFQQAALNQYAMPTNALSRINVMTNGNRPNPYWRTNLPIIPTNNTSSFGTNAPRQLTNASGWHYHGVAWTTNVNSTPR